MFAHDARHRSGQMPPVTSHENDRQGCDSLMTAPGLPAELKAAIEARLHGVSRHAAAGRAATMSQTYRDGGDSSAIRSEADALAYAVVRMPATYAAVMASLNALRAITPGFAPQRLLDVGAGPGTASWAAAEAFSSLRQFLLLDANAALRGLAIELARGSERLREISYLEGAAQDRLAAVEAADLVVASYMIGEIDPAQRPALADLLWAKTAGALLVVEPGTPAGYQRIISLRQQLIAAGARVAAPCPHDRSCPLSAPDWCHFTQRLPRSRAHQQLKDAERGFEDEKFSYVALTRAPSADHPARVLRQPVVTKAAVKATICTPQGVMEAVALRRQTEAYQRLKKTNWGDTIRFGPGDPEP
jgi:ribosomal protein RSM22 (predicted rRNA methylase)